MRIIVPIKQVPETSSVKMDPETGTIVRDGSMAVVNPLDLYAIETALRLRERHGGEVVALSMGPRRAELALREAVAMGCDAGYLLSDKKFGGADTWATSYVLAQTVRWLGEFDLIVAGERATDGDTGQVGPGIASWLDIPCATYVARLELEKDAAAAADPDHVGADRLVESGYQQLRLQLPALVTVVKEIGVPRLPTLSGKRRSMQTDIKILNAEEIDADPRYIGLAGSPTRVVKIKTPTVVRHGEHLDSRESPHETAPRVVQFLQEKGFAGGAGE